MALQGQSMRKKKERKQRGVSVSRYGGRKDSDEFSAWQSPNEARDVVEAHQGAQGQQGDTAQTQGLRDLLKIALF